MLLSYAGLVRSRGTARELTPGAVDDFKRIGPTGEPSPAPGSGGQAPFRRNRGLSVSIGWPSRLRCSVKSASETNTSMVSFPVKRFGRPLGE